MLHILEEEFTQISAIEEYRRLLGEVFETEDRERDSGIGKRLLAMINAVLPSASP